MQGNINNETLLVPYLYVKRICHLLVVGSEPNRDA